LRLQHILDKADAENPCLEVELIREQKDKYLPLLDPRTKMPRMKKAEHQNKDLVSKSAYLKRLDSKRAEILDLEGKIEKAYKADQEKTNLLIGNLDKMGEDPGLNALLAREYYKREILDEELQSILTQSINAQIDQQAVEALAASTMDRIKELEAFLTKRKVEFTPWSKKVDGNGKKP
jgi:hypothetical protein